ncbi:putative transmembrane protein 244 [Pteronotus mesoamericanus]|uniref:putative transmembrane protein 244 n=1 Tax=Pteronotus mesoamericanus TaxID=1884717 RepID=UPI0023EB6BFC|nr:transmembrane protein 244 [Pteronotus parnellii mesoamericanus]
MSQGGHNPDDSNSVHAELTTCQGSQLHHFQEAVPLRSAALLLASIQPRGSPSKVALQNLLMCVILFYTVYYVVVSMGCLLLAAYEFDVLAPFDFKTNPSWLNTNYKVLLVSTEATYFVCGLLFVLMVEEQVWDYAISVTVLHVAITSMIMLEFPLTSHWWAALGSGLISMICGGQTLAYCSFKDNFIYLELDDF